LQVRISFVHLHSSNFRFLWSWFIWWVNIW
jgi:hypothetical protein